MTPSEEWRPVLGYEGLYEVSALGRVRSLDRTVVDSIGRRFRRQGRVLSTNFARSEYPKVELVSADGSGVTRRVHAIVAEAFHGPRPDGLEVCHEDGDPHNNRATNLRYDTRLANEHDKVRPEFTHCKHGHELTGDNVLIEGTRRRCRTCRRRPRSPA